MEKKEMGWAGLHSNFAINSFNQRAKRGRGRENQRLIKKARLFWGEKKQRN
jgi:hypothetical protein